MNTTTTERETAEAGCIRSALQTERENFRSLTKIIQHNFETNSGLDNCSNSVSEETRFVPNDSFLNLNNVGQRICSLNKPPEITVMNMEFGKGGFTKPHLHDRSQTNYVLLGSYTDGVSGKVYNQGEIQVIQAQQLHSMISDMCLVTATWIPAFETMNIERLAPLENGTVMSVKSIVSHYYYFWKKKITNIFSKKKGLS